ncbi:hypothetical protein WR25_13309 [Diploscapter pachys]|uniref:Uncharacterized protein n=1 Tax=Diploscapter pachys TaxID=2018661 RepID=A0A2A2JY23_9BILA|nr:hypothetical protein WR25_13309 [Diploscapter pachys]
MIGMPRQNRGRTEQLLGQHRPRQHMRPSRAPKRQQQVRARPLGIVETVGRADQEAQLARAAIAPPLDPPREVQRAEHLALLVQHHPHRLRLHRGHLAAGIGQLGDARRPDDPLQIAIDQLRLGRSPDLAARHDVQEDRRRHGIAELPHALQVIEGAHLGPEQVDDDVIGVDQHPVGSLQPFDPHRTAELGLHLFGDLVGHRCDLPRRAAAGDHHMVSDRRFARERNRNDLFGLIVVQRRQDQSQQRFDFGRVGRTHGLGGTRQGDSWVAGPASVPVPVGIGRTDRGGGGRVGAEAQQHECRQTPRGPMLRLACGPLEAPQPTHRDTREGLVVIPRTRDHRNRHRAGDLAPPAPAMKLRQIVRPHQPDELPPGVTPLQLAQRVERVARIEPRLDIARPDRRPPRHPLGRREPRRQRRHVARAALQRIARRHQPPRLVELQRPDRGERDRPMPAMRRVERSTEQAGDPIQQKKVSFRDPPLARVPVNDRAGSGKLTEEAASSNGRPPYLVGKIGIAFGIKHVDPRKVGLRAGSPGDGPHPRLRAATRSSNHASISSWLMPPSRSIESIPS